MDMSDLTGGMSNVFYCPFSAVKRTLEKHFPPDVIDALELIVDGMNVLNNENQQMRKHLLEMQTEMINLLRIINNNHEIVAAISQRLGVKTNEQ